MTFDWHFFFTHLLNLSPGYFGAMQRTILLAVIAQTLGIALGLFLGIARLSKFRPIRYAAAVYVWMLRAVPELVILMLLFTGLAAAEIYRFEDAYLFGQIKVSAGFQAACVGLAIREAGYMGEIFRNGIQSVDRRQVEAAKALGMRRSTMLRRVIIPQAMRVIIPPMGNQFNVMLKVTSLAAVIGVPELFQTTGTYAAQTFRVFELFVGLAVNYALMTSVWSVVQSVIEARLSRHEATAGSRTLLGRIREHLIGTGGREAGQTT
ncbi:amino acid ABC transporter permease [Microtetraspora malaysiensis]|uniref:Amino acid ABC transporter permease n=1 Tax=Microtetraspora malaysiensis TaxID=161358 RepID=A0ABW6T566_9ACTN